MRLSGISTFEAGPPYSITMGIDTAFVGGSAAIFPDASSAPVAHDIRRSNGIYITPTSFTTPPFGQCGTLARNTFHGPGISNFDLGIMKNIALAEPLRVQFRGELFNAFNHAQFVFAGSSLASAISAPVSGSTPFIQYVDPSQFGRAGARSARIAQVAVKLIW